MQGPFFLESEVSTLSVTTRFGYLKEKGVALVGERTVRDLKAHEVLVRLQGCNICTTDYQQWMGLREHQGYPMAGGHESCGIVAEVGPEVHSVKPGDYVAVGYDTSCGYCEPCRTGNDYECENAKPDPALSEDGYWGYFGFGEYAIQGERSLFKMDKSLSSAEAGFLEPVATVVSGIKQLRVKPLETVCVVGAGTMGMLNAQVARAFGARVIISEGMPKKLEAARELGFEAIDFTQEDVVARVKEFTNGRGVDCVILAVLNEFVLKQAFDLIKANKGRILVFAAGYPAPKLELDANMIHYRRCEIIGTYCGEMEDFADAAELLNSRAIDVRPLCEPRQYSIDEIQEAFEAAATPGMFRVHVKTGNDVA